jgi:YspA, cpYpsA-related SLOG family
LGGNAHTLYVQVLCLWDTDIMRVMVTGSRDWSDHITVQSALVVVGVTMTKKNEKITLIHGGATGADTIAAKAAKELEWEIEEFKPDWSMGRRGGPLRNVAILESGVDIVLAFWKNRSPGTRHAIETARTMGIPIKLHEV